MQVRPVFRLARAVVFATVCTGLAAAGHTMASHAPVPPPAVVAGLGVLILVGLALAGVERSLPTILGSLVGGQFLLHVLFAACQHRTYASGGGSGQYDLHAGHLGHDSVVSVGHEGLVPAGFGGVSMTLVHLVAAVVSAWWLRRGERAVWGLARKVAATLARPAFALLTEPAPPVTRSSSAPRATRTPRLRGAVLRHVLVRRGPPSPSTAFA
jgi:hypothetical protein